MVGKGIAIVFALVLATTGAQADNASALAGKTLVAKSASIVTGADGTLSGKVGKDELSGTWKVDGDKFCRSITAPERLAGSACQAMKIKGNTVTITREDGTTIKYEIK